MKLRSFLMLLASVTLALAFVSCSDSGSANNDTQENSLESMDLYLPSTDLDDPSMFEATIERDYSLENCLTGEEIQRLGDPRERGRQNRNPLFRIFRQLELTPDQMAEVSVFMQDHFDCMLDVRLQIRDAVEEIVESAREERRAIIEAFRNGEITREEAISDIREINAETRVLMNEAFNELNLKALLDECRDTLFDNIRSILDDDQKAIWDEWVANLPE